MSQMQEGRCLIRDRKNRSPGLTGRKEVNKMLNTISNVSTFNGYRVQSSVLPEAQQKKEDSSQSQKPVDDKVTISRKEGALEQVYTQKETKLEQTYENESQKLEREYLQEKDRLEKEFRRKRMALGVDLYA